MINLKTLTVKNFMSVGNSTQAVDFEREDLTLVLGNNLDLGGDGSRNGTGKTTIINALSYALYGQALTNIKLGNLINKTNSKNMLCTVQFELNGTDYRIERGRGPNVLKFYVDDLEQEEGNEAQGEMRETQRVIEDTLGITHEMFKHIVALNTYTQPFLSLRANDQRAIIEELLGITVLSEKADSLKEQSKRVKDDIKEEEFRIKAVLEANQHIEDQINGLRRRQKMWTEKRDADIVQLHTAIEQLSHVDIEAELAAFEAITAYNEKKTQVDTLAAFVTATESANTKLLTKTKKLEKEIEALRDHKCHACGQDLHDSKHEEVLATKETDLQEAVDAIIEGEKQLEEARSGLELLGELDAKPVTFYRTIQEAYEHKNSISQLEQQIETKAKEEDPYAEQIEEMTHTAVQEVSYEKMNDLTQMAEHQEFLLKLLTNKDSFVRKKIIDQNLAYLNTRLQHYLDKIGLRHSVQFLNDLSVEITDLGRDLDFDNLSRGERNRLILSLSWAFRDVWESLYTPINLVFIDELIDSGMDSQGVENALGILKGFSRDRGKSVWLVSHKEELIGRVHNTLNVIKENGFTTYSSEEA
jgi:DNA repair exonuclease SbcCD ATPase subunit